MFSWILCALLSFAWADQFAVVIDTSKSMSGYRSSAGWVAGQDVNKLSLLGTMMLADLLDPSEDELFVTSFEENLNLRGITQFPTVRSTFYRRKDIADLTEVGTQDFRTLLLNNIQYNARQTIFTPYIDQAVQQLKVRSSQHDNNVVIVLTDGKSEKEEMEVEAFKRIGTEARNANIEIYFIQIGRRPYDLASWFKLRGNGGHILVSPNKVDEMLGAFATVLDETTNRQLKEYSNGHPSYVVKNRSKNIIVDSMVSKFDVIAVNPSAALIQDRHDVLTNPSGALLSNLRAQDKDTTGAVSDSRGTVLKSYRRLRVERPRGGAGTFGGNWVLKDTKQNLKFFIVEEYSWHVGFKLRAQMDQHPTEPTYLQSPAGSPLYVPAGATICMDSQVYKDAGQTDVVPFSEIQTLWNAGDIKLTSTVEVGSGHRVTSSQNGATDFANDGSPGKPSAEIVDVVSGDSVFSACWTPSEEEVGKIATLQVSFQDVRTKSKTSSSIRKIQVIPPMRLVPEPRLLNLRNDVEETLFTNDVGVDSFALTKEQSTFSELDSGAWELGKAKFIVEIGFCDGVAVTNANFERCPDDKWKTGLRGLQESAICRSCEFKLSPSTPTDVDNLLIPSTEFVDDDNVVRLGWDSSNNHWQLDEQANDGKRTLSVKMGPRTEAGTEQQLRLRLIPADPYYRVFIPPVDIGLQIKAGKPSFMESFGPLFLLLFLLTGGFAIMHYARRPMTLPVGLEIAVWSGNPNKPTNWVSCPTMVEYTFEEYNITLVATENGAAIKPTDRVEKRQGGRWSDVPVSEGKICLVTGVTYRYQNQFIQLRTQGK